MVSRRDDVDLCACSDGHDDYLRNSDLAHACRWMFLGHPSIDVDSGAAQSPMRPSLAYPDT